MGKLTTDRLSTLRDYYLNQEDGQGDYEDIFGHIDAVEAERDALRAALKRAENMCARSVACGAVIREALQREAHNGACRIFFAEKLCTCSVGRDEESGEL